MITKLLNKIISNKKVKQNRCGWFIVMNSVLFLFFYQDDSVAKKRLNKVKISKKNNYLEVKKYFIDNEQLVKEEEIKIVGNSRVKRQEIINLLAIQELGNKTRIDIDQSIKKLYESALFADIKISEIEKDKILIEVKENPLIAEIKFSGNKKIEEKILKSEIIMKERSIFSKSKLQSDIKRISDIYIKSGRFLAKIEPKIIAKEDGVINLIFEVFEGPKAKISTINFIGNNNFSDSELFSEIATKRSSWYRIFSSADSFDGDRIDFDKEKLNRFYQNSGYADFNVISVNSQLSRDKLKFYIVFIIEEGIKYRFNEVNIVNNVKNFDEKLLKNKILVKKKQLYSLDLIERTIDQITETMSENSFAFTNIEPILKRNKNDKTIDIDFVINPTTSVYINKIDIVGNIRTLDEVIRRELRIIEGDPYNASKINRSKQRIENLGFFERVDFKVKRLEETDKVNIEIEVKEKKTGELNFMFGYGTVDKFSSNIGVRERNLFGTGRELGINLQKTTFSKAVDLSYTKPYLLDTTLDGGFDIFQYNNVKRYGIPYNQQGSGFTLRGDYFITEFLRHQIRYSYRNESLQNVDINASQNIKNLEGIFTSSTIGQSFLIDKRNNRFDPRRGYIISASQDLSYFGGNIKNNKYEANFAYYMPTFNDNYILKLSTRGGFINGIGQDVRSNYGFFLGGNNFRGFQFGGIGPRAKLADGTAKGGNTIGGNLYYVGTVEYRFPMGLPKELGIYGILFSDNGTVKKVDNINRNGYGVVDTGSIRSSYGVSIAWSSPMGPIRFDFAKIAKKEVFDNSQNFQFNFGANF